MIILSYYKLSLYIYQQRYMLSQNFLTINQKLLVEYTTLPLTLHLNFNTAHSTSSTRTNFLFKVSSIKNKQHGYGYGECGLPPKKPGIYMSDLGDCFMFMEMLRKRCEGYDQGLSRKEYFQFLGEIEGLAGELTLFGELRKILSLQEENQAVFLLNLLRDIEQQHYRAPKSALQFAILNYLSHNNKTDLFTLIYGPITPQLSHKISQTYSFYTISLTQPKQMLENTIKHLHYTKYIKIKYNHNYKQLLDFLKLVTQYERDHHSHHLYKIQFIIDANCSWTPEIYRLFEEELRTDQELVQKILYVEQPYDFQIKQYQAWVDVCSKTGLKIMVDQSFRNQEDLEKVSKVCHAINVKSQKAGGFFNTLKAALYALNGPNQQNSLDVVFGSMVSTQLGCAQTYLLAPLAKYMDIDGSLLVKQPSIEGGFSWNSLESKKTKQEQISGQIIQDQKQDGIGVDSTILHTYF